MTKFSSALNRHERGSAAVEFALILPLLVLLLAFLLFFGRLFGHYTVALKAAHDASTFLAMARIAEVGIAKDSVEEIEVAKIARLIAVTELAELNPGKGAKPFVDVRCDNDTCLGDKVPSVVAVKVRMRMFDAFLSGITSELVGSEGIWLYAEVQVPYVGN